jgi:hypothetical protein
MEEYHGIYQLVKEGCGNERTISYGRRKGTARNTTAFASLLQRYLHFHPYLRAARASSWHLDTQLQWNQYLS